ncbi:Degenerin [Aphelenchoides besseyi]|nr:Degenerin [Aphelenchoides besseyi]
MTSIQPTETATGAKTGSGSAGSVSSRGPTGSVRPRSLQKGVSEDSVATRSTRRPLHPAERRAQQLGLPAFNTSIDKPSNPQHRMQALRRLSRADFSSIRRHRFRGQLNYAQIRDRFTKQTTIHGVSHAYTAPNKTHKWAWLILFSICFLLFSIQVLFLLLKYLSHPKTVDLDLKFENAPFPSVTLCNLNPYKASAIGQDPSTRSMMAAFQTLRTTGSSEGVAAAIAATQSRRRLRRELNKSTNNTNRRYLQVYAQCYCEINRLSGERRPGSCYGAHKGQIQLSFSDSNLHNFHPTRCLCQLDWTSKAIWPCFPYNTWKEKVCTECVPESGHCPMRFYRGKQDEHKLKYDIDVCLCHREYNHCIANNENGEIPEIVPTFDVSQLNFTETFVRAPGGAKTTKTTTTTTTEAPEIRQALGYEELKDEIAINTQARQNLMFAVEEKPLTERVGLSQSKDELILKCSFNQRDCDIEHDFNLHYDPTYGNCYTFNWNRTKQVNAHRAGANYGLRVILYANVSEYLPTSEAVGFRITVHDKWNVPFPDAFGHNAPTGFMSSFGVRMKQFIRITAPYGRCQEGGEDKDGYIYKGFNYSVEGCHRSCTQNEIIKTCGCADPMYPVPKVAKSCKMTDPIARDCIKNTTQHLGQLIAESENDHCDCHQPCSEIGYEVSYSAARWPSGTTKLMECEINDDLCMEKYRKNAAMIQIFFEELNFETLTESQAYSFNSFIADFGGLLGLWIGASIISLFELVALGIYFYQAYARERKLSISSSTRRNVVQTPKKISTTSIYRPRTPTPSTPKSRLSLLIDDPDPEPMRLEVEDCNESDSGGHSTSASKKSFPYWPPGQELPCTCLYNSNGNIISMSALCAEHGFMVRRNTEYGLEDYDEEAEDEETFREENES